MEDLERYYQQNCQRLYAVSYLYLKDASEAEDVVQTVFLRCIEHGMRFHDDEHAKAWFLRCAKNDCISRLRKRGRQKIDSDENMDQYAAEPTPDTPLLDVMMTLPEKDREILYLRYVEELSDRPIASLLKKNESTVRTRLSRAREALRKKWNEGG